MNKISLIDGDSSFNVSVCEAARPLRTVLFAVGAGGNPDRHLPLLESLVGQGCAVVAPHFDRMVSLYPSEDELVLRARRLRLALDRVALPSVPVVGVGHSIGTSLLIAMAGGLMWMREGRQLPIDPDARLARLALLAPATGFFQAPHALDSVRAPILAWAGGLDSITPPAQAFYLKDVLGDRIPVEVRVVEDAGHFTFMNTLPPQVVDVMVEREGFLSSLASDLCRFVMG